MEINNYRMYNKLYQINKFKSRWGGEIVEQPIYFKNPIKVLGRKTIRNVHFIKKIRDQQEVTCHH